MRVKLAYTAETKRRPSRQHFNALRKGIFVRLLRPFLERYVPFNHYRTLYKDFVNLMTKLECVLYGRTETVEDQSSNLDLGESAMPAMLRA